MHWCAQAPGMSLPERIKPLTVTRAGIVGTIVVLAVAATCARLGFWQLSRLHERTTRNQLLDRRMQLPPLQIQGPGLDTAGLLYRRAEVSGRFDHDRTIVLPGRALRGAPGVHVLTPVLLGGGYSAVLVNRGWVPAADAATVNFDSLRTSPEIRLTGLILAFPGSSRRKPSRNPVRDTVFRRSWFSPDPEAIRRQYPYKLLPFELQALPDDDARGFPIRLPPPVLDRGPHLGYAIQWFCFAAIALIGWTILMIRKGEVRRD